ncbi:MAG TPA: cytochrome b/b6 domain-containing protein [Roseiarcus sp.]|nr:cytochrome b/b6 domain-containing protein [Roseiarcus sp.]
MNQPSNNASAEQSDQRGDRLVPVWDLPTRLFHWLAVGLIAAAYATWRLDWMVWHARAGYALLALLLFRLLWGCFGGETARFRSFVAPPKAALRYLRRALRGAPERHIGHNPAGGWMVLLLLALMLGQALTGLYVDNDIADEGPLTEFVPAAVANAIAALHDDFLWDALLAAAALHVLAVAAYAAKGRNLVAPMITGRARAPADAMPPFPAGAGRAVILLAASACATAALVRFL